jgi:hypothetical protein
MRFWRYILKIILEDRIGSAVIRGTLKIENIV